MYKQDSEFKSVQKKLMAAVAMVLIASIMVVSSSYAWFTLSTAPEVTGITTSVGSNGNLEMALNVTGNAGNITTTDAASSDPYTSNPFWGNLVNLSDTRYGLSQISLAPARPNLTKLDDSTKEYMVSVEDTTAYKAEGAKYEGNTIKEVSDGTITYTGADDAAVTVTLANAGTYVVGGSYNDGTTDYTITAVQPGTVTYEVATANYAVNLGNNYYLMTAVYGTDGRVSKLEANAESATFNGTDFSGGTDDYGVRGVGTVSGLTAAEIALRNAKTVITDTKANTLYLARKSLQEDSVKLANIIIAEQMATGSTFGATDYNNIEAAIASLNDVVNGLEDAMKAVVVAVGVAQKQTFTADDVTISTTGITLKTGTVDWSNLTSLETYLKEAAGVIATMRNDLTGATTELSSITKDDEYTFAELTGPMYKIFSMDDLLVDGKKISEYGNKIDIGMAIMKGAPLTLVDGIYADIALFIENYDAQTSIHVEGNFSGIGAIDDDFDVSMTTEVSAPACGFYLPYYITALSTVTVAGGEETTATPISDLYAYIIDLGFRTNASGSYLQLQTDAKNRVQDSEHTMGHGSSMSFNITSTGYTQEQLVGLMSAIRVMFFDTTTGKVHGIAALDMGKTETEYTENVTSTTALKAGDTYNGYTVKSVEGETAPTTEGGNYTYSKVTVYVPNYTVEETGTVTAKLYLYGYTVDASNKITLSTKLEDDNLLALQQNVATAVSTMVYLDGDLVDNSDVGISGKTVEGTMNLQFSSSADLVPMEYTFTADGTEATTPTLAAPSLTLSGSDLSWATVENATGYTVAYSNADQSVTGTLTATGTSINLQTALDDKGVAADTYTIVVTANADGYTSSYASESYAYTPTT